MVLSTYTRIVRRDATPKKEAIPFLTGRAQVTLSRNRTRNPVGAPRCGRSCRRT